MSIMTKTGVDENGNEAEVVSSGYVGEIKMFGYAGVPEHCLACDGSLLSITAYPELYAKLGTQHGGDGVTTFALPTAEDVIYAAGNGRAVGAAVADGLPNIQGTASFRRVSDSGSNTLSVFGSIGNYVTSGAIQGALTEGNPYVDYIGVGYGASSGQHGDELSFDASRSSAIYGASDHVQPKGTAFNFCIVYE